MKRWKQIGAACLAAVLAAAGPAPAAWAASPEFSRTAEEWARLRDNVMEYDELAGLIHEYNVTVQKNQIDIIKKKNDDLVTRDQFAQDYRDAASDYRSSITGDDAMNDAANEVKAAQADQTADDMVEDLTVYQLTYDQTEAGLVDTAQSSMISYFQQLNELESTKDKLTLLEAIYQSTLAKKSVGMATQVDVLSAQEDVENTKVSIEKLSASIEKTRQSLCLMLGWSYNASPEIRSIPAVDLEKIGAMNPEADKAKALENNYTLKINKRKLQNAAAELTKQSLTRTIADNEQQIGSDLVKKYQAVLQAKAAYDQAQADSVLESKNMDTAERKYQVGDLSRLQYQQQQNAYNTKNIAVKNAELTLYQAIQTYENAVNGLASTGG